MTGPETNAEDDPPIDKTVFPAGVTGMPSNQAAAELLARLHARATEPIDGLLDMLCDGVSTADLMQRWCQAHPDQAELWCRIAQAQPASAAELDAAKQQAKLGFRPGSEVMLRHAAMLAYLLAVAAGILQQDQVRSSIQPDVLDEWFTAVAGAAPGQAISALLTDAADRLHGRSG